jgi:carbon-monoxide dehydrogenase small subunit
MTRVEVTLTVDGVVYPVSVAPHETLLDVLRDELALTGTKANCLAGECGACTVLVDGRAVNACLYLVVRADGRRIETVAGLRRAGALHPLQEAFIEQGAVQCGYCTPGMLMSLHALFASAPDPDTAEIERALAGNLCRCTGYSAIRRAISATAARREQAP